MNRSPPRRCDLRSDAPRTWETKNLQEVNRPHGPIFGLSDAHGGRLLVVFPGGVIPLLRDGE